MKFFSALTRAWSFVCTELHRETIRCVHLCKAGDVTHMVATDGARLARFTITDMQGVVWDGKPCNIPPTVKLLLRECRNDLVTITEGCAVVDGIDAIPGTIPRHDWQMRFPEYMRVIPNVEGWQSCELDGKELAKAWKGFKPKTVWALDLRLTEMLGGVRLISPRVYRSIDRGAGLYIHEDGPTLRVKASELVDNPQPTGNAKHDRVTCFAEVEYHSTDRITKPQVFLNADSVLVALNGRKGTLTYNGRFDPVRIDFENEVHVVMPVRM